MHDATEYQEAIKEYEQEYSNWQLIRDLAKNILDGNKDAYIEAIRQVAPFSEISQLGSRIEFGAEGKNIITATLHVNTEEVIPSEQKSQLKSGKLFQ